MAKVSIKRRKDNVRADGKAAIYAVIYISGSKIRIPVDLAASENEWDEASQRFKGRSPEIRDKNLIISNVVAKITNILVRSRLTGETLTKDRFLAQYRCPGGTMNFIDYARQHLDILKKALQPETLKNHLAVLKKLNAYNPDLLINEITPEWLQAYAMHLRKYHNNNSGTIGKNMCIIRMHYNAAMRAGMVNSNPFEVYKIPSSEPAVVYLTEDELNSLSRLYNSDTLPDNEQDVLRFFLFMAFTAMHISDARALQIEQIRGNEIHYRRIKTHTRVNMPLSKPAAKLVNYYRDGRSRGNLIRNLPSDQCFNRLIKIICKRVGIIKPVSAKAARHTFATLYYKKNAGDLGTLSKLLGHMSINTTMIYAHIMRDSRISGVAAFDDML